MKSVKKNISVFLCIIMLLGLLGNMQLTVYAVDPIKNPGFENGTTANGKTPIDWTAYSWATKNGLFEHGVATDVSHAGNCSAYIEAVTSAYAGYVTTVQVPAGSTAATISFWAKGSSDYADNFAYIMIAGTGINLTDHFAPGTEWTKHEYPVTVPAGTTTITIRLTSIYATFWGNGANPAGKIYFDDVGASFTNADAGVYEDSFEQTIAGSPSLLEGRLLPKEWTFYDWSNPAAPVVDAGATNEIAYDGVNSAYIKSVGNAYAGFVSKGFTIDANTPGYKFTYRIKKSEDYAGNTPYVFVTCFNGGSFLSVINPGSVTVSAGEWTENTITVTSDKLAQGTNRICLNLTSTKSTTGTPAGTLYYDLVRVEKIDEIDMPVNISIKGAKSGNWWVLGEDVIFKSVSGIPAKVTDIKGTVYDSKNNKVVEASVSPAALSTTGWKWTPEEPGYYEVGFTAIDNNGNEYELSNKYSLPQLSNPSITQNFSRNRNSFVVAAAETKPVSERNEMLGFNMFPSLRADELMGYADLVGFQFARYWMSWGELNGSTKWAINPEQSVYIWDKYDQQFSIVDKYGFDVTGTVFGTPQWASPHPENTNVNVCVTGFAAYAPTDMTYFSDFLNMLIGRYGSRINTWEIWNEPHLPGGSIYWSDTPENFVELLKTGYETIKAAQPDSDVWMGGIARRYLPFYKEVLKLGGNNYFDTLAIHGYDQYPEDFYELDRDMGLQPKPWVDSEGHMILVSPTAEKIDYTEPEIAKRMMDEYFRQIKFGAKKITFFDIQNYAEMEALPWARQTGSSYHSSGLFRRLPYPEPRLAADVAFNFFDEMGKDFSYKKEYVFGNGQKAVLFDNDGATFMALWTDGQETQAVDSVLAQCFDADTSIIDWEGKSIAVSGDANIQPSTMYFIENFDSTPLNSLEDADGEVVYSEYEKQIENVVVPEAEGNTVPVFAPATNEITEGIKWIDEDWEWISSERKEPEFDAKCAVSFTDNGMDLIVDVTDSIYYQTETNPLYMYRGDSVQFAIDTMGYSMGGDRMEFQVGKINDQAVIYKEAAPYIGGDLPTNYTPFRNIVKYGSVTIERDDQNHTVYKIHLDNTEIYPFVLNPEKPVRFSILVNNNNGTGRLGYMEWSKGIGEEKNPVKYGKVLVEPVISSISAISVITRKKVPPVLPLTVAVDYSDGTSRNLNVTWDPVDEEKYQKKGVFTVNGTVEGTEIKAVANVTVVNKKLDKKD